MKFYFIFLIAALTHHALHAQVSVKNTNVIAQLKQGKTHLAFHDSSTESFRYFKQLLEANWRITPIEWVNDSTTIRKSNFSNSYLSIDVQAVNEYMPPLYRVFMHLYMYQLDTIVKKKQMTIDTVKVTLGEIELYISSKQLANLGYIRSLDFHGNRTFWNWGRGMFQNYIQMLDALLEEQKKNIG